MTWENRFSLMQAIYGLIEDRLAQPFPRLADDAASENRLEEIVAWTAQVLATERNIGDHRFLFCKAEIRGYVAEVMINEERDDRELALAVEMVTQIVEAASKRVPMRKWQPEEFVCDPGGGPLSPDNRELNDLW